ncbi:hypothetical protein C3941_08815 [Kaistia algarum]|uniref:DUF5330 domain-containing protein n=1 Tax=Kaistia algarum TaxID=2083279 RepID=UPI000CE73138|nr:DUF5330 domain-containing protein [Kaistia algarum]MCX5512159.1 DUF5330 domain-containing protein [Kaistia algarum]PPE80260.1 hypothetical protein C3941_08815 [Kaistia algarum]
MFLFRAAFWLTLVVFLLPLDSKDGSSGPGANAFDAIVAARGAIIDMAGMCTRQPEVCSNGGAALATFGSKAREGVSLIYGVINSKLAGNPGQEADPAHEAARGTLRQEDLGPTWRAPAVGGKA